MNPHVYASRTSLGSLLGPLAKPYVCKAIVKLCVLNEFCLNCKFSKSTWQIIYCK